ncbi:MAG TPA: gluconate:proton symporter [Lactobacillus sp.]|nr:gluconate:proton symporter [Lactobacillus sp.]
MQNIIVGILLLLTYFAFVYYAVRGGNLTVGFMVMTIAWTLIGMIPYHIAMVQVFAAPVTKYGGTIMYIIFGSWFGRVLVDTGIAGSISRQTQKIGQKSPVLATILICLVTALIFSSTYGVGSVIAIGVILIPIMLQIGVPKNVAVSAFTLSIGAAMFINVVQFKQSSAFVPGVAYNAKFLRYGATAMAVQLAVVIVFILVNARKIRKGTPTALEVDEEAAGITESSKREVHWFAYIVPIIPVFCVIFLKWDAIPALLSATLLAMLLTGYFKSYKGFVKFMNATITKAISDISGLIIMLLIVVMFQAAAVKDTERFASLFSNIIPNNTFVIMLTFAILAPLALFRGPLMLYGAGSATAAVFVGLNRFNPWFLYGLLTTPSYMAVSSDITQSWNLWSVNYTKLTIKEFMLTGVPWAWGAAILQEIVAWSMFGR